jgi:energy-coupling factor transporter ATP-binding protein EcfA2
MISHSGAGKTTLAKLIAGLLKPSENPEAMLFSATILDEVVFALRNFGFPQARWRAGSAQRWRRSTPGSR